MGAKSFKVGQDDLRGRIPNEVIDQLERLHVGRIADGYITGEADAALAREVGEIKRHVAALRDHRNNAGRHLPAERVRISPDRCNSGAVRPEHASARRRDGPNQIFLDPAPLLADLAEASRDHDDAARPLGDAVSDHLRNRIGRHGDDGEIHFIGTARIDGYALWPRISAAVGWIG